MLISTLASAKYEPIQNVLPELARVRRDLKILTKAEGDDNGLIDILKTWIIFIPVNVLKLLIYAIDTITSVFSSIMGQLDLFLQNILDQLNSW